MVARGIKTLKELGIVVDEPCMLSTVPAGEIFEIISVERVSRAGLDYFLVRTKDGAIYEGCAIKHKLDLFDKLIAFYKNHNDTMILKLCKSRGGSYWFEDLSPADREIYEKKKREKEISDKKSKDGAFLEYVEKKKAEIVAEEK